MNKKILLVFSILLFAGVASAGSFSYSSYGYSSAYTNYQAQPDFRSFYTSNQINSIWSIMNDSQCQARQDILLNIAPAGCEPAVVRSDLLADQDVPVFCQVDGLQINPLINIKQIQNIEFKGNYPPAVSGVGFYPARAAIGTSDILLGDPVINNFGYVVVILRRNPIEKNLSDSVEVNLTASIQYNAGNAFGVGQSEFILRPNSDDEWATQKLAQSFLSGQYYLRLDYADANQAKISLYQKDAVVSSVTINKGQTSNSIYMPGSYCQVAFRFAYDDFIDAQDKATIEIDNGNGNDRIELYNGMTFLDGKCTVQRININPSTKNTGSVDVSCSGKKTTLSIGGIAPTIGSSTTVVTGGTNRGTGIIGISNSASTTGTGGTANSANAATASGPVDGNYSDTRVFPGFANGAGLDEYFDKTIKAYEKVANDYPNEVTMDTANLADNAKLYYGKQSLIMAIDWVNNGFQIKQKTLCDLKKLYIDKYPSDSLSAIYQEDLSNCLTLDYSKSADSVQIDGKFRSIRLVSLEKPSSGEVSNADFSFSGSKGAVVLPEGQGVALKDASRQISFENIKDIKLESINSEDSVSISYDCVDTTITKTGGTTGSTKVNSGTTSGTKTLTNTGGFFNICYGTSIRLDKVNQNKVAKVRVLPEAQRTETETNLSVRIGIEKRAIQLSPEMTAQKILSLNASIKKWESISNGLAKVVTGLKAACFATSAALTVKNFLSGMGGETVARDQAMRGDNGWTKRCADAVSSGKQVVESDGVTKGGTYSSVTQCYNGEEKAINAEIQARSDAIKKVNGDISQAEKGNTKPGILDSSVNVDQAKVAYAQQLRNNYPGKFDFLSTDGTGANYYSYADLRDLETNYILSQEGNSAATKAFSDTKSRISAAEGLAQEAAVQQKYASQFGGDATPIGDITQNQVATGKIVAYDPIKNTLAGQSAASLGISPVTGANAAMFVTGTKAIGGTSGAVNGPSGITSPNRTATDYLLIGQKSSNGGFVPTVVYDAQKNGNDIVSYNIDNTYSSNIQQFKTDYKVSNFQEKQTGGYKNPMSGKDRVVRYFGFGTYEGLASYVPFDPDNGWYVKVYDVLAVGDATASYDKSGNPRIFDICNVMPDGIVDSQDDCSRVNMGVNDGLPILGLSQQISTQLIANAREALRQANQQKGGSAVTIKTGTGTYHFGMGDSTAAAPATQCQDFMSIDDCKVLFNVCDPVICPPSRCNFGGKYQVADVVQTGIIGSILLCLPNFKEGVYIPVCLTGIQAGIDSFVSIMEAHRDCLQENLDKGTMNGICDQIYSIYLCEFFWRQVAPVVNILVPKLFELAYTGGQQGARGGGEYLTVQAAWNNMQKSVDYFTQEYGAKSFEVFKNGNIAEIGSEMCKSFISAKSPTSIQSAIAPESPTQFYAWFDSIKYTTATYPATDQYKVFYHIFAGNDAGVSYAVYLKSPPSSQVYAANQQVFVASGFITAGQSKTETKDFTAPEGYTQLCVNINNEEKCGFKSVSTDFALNYVKDQAISDQSMQTGITSSKDCMSGSPTLSMTGNDLNLGSAAGELVSPQVSQSGIIRVCATKNPGASTDPTRYVNVGYCDTQNLVCWLDKQSVSNAITPEDNLVRNQTLTQLGNTVTAQLNSQGVITDINDPAFTGKINGFTTAKDAIANQFKTGVTDKNSLDLAINNLVGNINSNITGALTLNVHKAWMYQLIGDVYGVGLGAYGTDLKNYLSKNAITVNTGSTSSYVPGDFILSTVFDYNSNTGKQISIQQIDSSNKPVDTGLYISGNDIYITRDSSSGGDEKVGTISSSNGNNVISLPNSPFVSPDYWNLDGKIIIGDVISGNDGQITPTGGSISGVYDLSTVFDYNNNNNKISIMQVSGECTRVDTGLYIFEDKIYDGKGAKIGDFKLDTIKNQYLIGLDNIYINNGGAYSNLNGLIVSGNKLVNLDGTISVSSVNCISMLNIVAAGTDPNTADSPKGTWGLYKNGIYTKMYLTSINPKGSGKLLYSTGKQLIGSTVSAGDYLQGVIHVTKDTLNKYGLGEYYDSLQGSYVSGDKLNFMYINEKDYTSTETGNSFVNYIFATEKYGDNFYGALPYFINGNIIGAEPYINYGDGVYNNYVESAKVGDVNNNGITLISSTNLQSAPGFSPESLQIINYSNYYNVFNKATIEITANGLRKIIPNWAPATSQIAPVTPGITAVQTGFTINVFNPGVSSDSDPINNEYFECKMSDTKNNVIYILRSSMVAVNSIISYRLYKVNGGIEEQKSNDVHLDNNGKLVVSDGTLSDDEKTRIVTPLLTNCKKLFDNYLPLTKDDLAKEKFSSIYFSDVGGVISSSLKVLVLGNNYEVRRTFNTLSDWDFYGAGASPLVKNGWTVWENKLYNQMVGEARTRFLSSLYSSWIGTPIELEDDAYNRYFTGWFWIEKYPTNNLAYNYVKNSNSYIWKSTMADGKEIDIKTLTDDNVKLTDSMGAVTLLNTYKNKFKDGFKLLLDRASKQTGIYTGDGANTALYAGNVNFYHNFNDASSNVPSSTDIFEIKNLNLYFKYTDADGWVFYKKGGFIHWANSFQDDKLDSDGAIIFDVLKEIDQSDTTKDKFIDGAIAIFKLGNNINSLNSQ